MAVYGPGERLLLRHESPPRGSCQSKRPRPPPTWARRATSLESPMQRPFLLLPILGFPLLSSMAAAQTRIASPAAEQLFQADDLTPAEEDALRERLLRSGTAPESLDIRAQSHLLGGVPISVGLDWKATYGSDGMTFTPLLGKQAPHTRSLHFQFHSVQVGEQRIEGLDLFAQPVLKAGQVVFERGRGVSEIYAATQEGLEQSFLFESLPGRDGDLIVRGSFSTDLLDSGATGDSLLLNEPGLASVRVDKVIGIDARGARVNGQLRWVEDQLEVVLPAAFLATAELPLLLDPLYTVELSATDNTFSADQVDVAFGTSDYDEFIMVFCRYFSQFDPDIYGTTKTTTGGPGLSLFAFESVVGTFDQEPSVAFNVGEGQFAIAWQRSASPNAENDILLTSINAGEGLVQSSILMATGIENQSHPDVGGEDTLGFDRVVVVYQSSGDIRIASVKVPTHATPILVQEAVIPSMLNIYDRPAVTKSGGGPGVYLVAAEADFGSDRDISMVAVNYLGSVLTTQWR